MPQTPATMPEARFRTIKKKAPSAGVSTASKVQQPQALAAAAGRPPATKTAEAKVAAKPKAKRKPGAAIAAWWPVAVGVFLCGFVGEWHATAQEAGIWAERLLFPLALLMQHREIGIDAQMTTVMPQWAIYAQLPLDGLLTKLTLDGSKSLKLAIAQFFLVHAVFAFALWLLTYLGK